MGFDVMLSPAEFRELDIEPTCHRLGQWLRHFDVDFYKNHPHSNGHADLASLTDGELVRHFVMRGWREGRSYSRFLHSFIEPTFYREFHSELQLSSDADAVKHWMYEGFFEQRIPNSVTRDVLAADVHLFQFGKVGSKAIEKALIEAGYSKMIMHLHWPNEMLWTYPDCLLAYEDVVAYRRNKGITFITGVRDPFARLISGYFQANWDTKRRFDLNTPSAEVMRTIADSAVTEDDMDRLLSWFDHGYYSGINVYDTPFAPDRGFTTITHGHVKVFLYRLENLADLEPPLQRLTGLHLSLSPTNTAESKPFAELYKHVVNTIRFSRPLVERVLASQFVRHFYNEHERHGMFERWSA